MIKWGHADTVCTITYANEHVTELLKEAIALGHIFVRGNIMEGSRMLHA